ncbi:MAG TPA: amidohydrolase family protein, partial [Longimicrobium sp.]|nr:amidohydrolase family protein [Longimicrobium sp.]
MTRPTLAAAAAAALCLTSALSAQNYPVKGTGTVVLRAARVIDGTGAAPILNGEVVVTDDRIVSVGRRGAAAPAGARVVDLGDATLLPGFIDAHVHIIGRALGQPGADEALVHEYPGFGAIVGAENARRTLMSGFTSVRVLGSPDFQDVALRKAIDEGWTVGPRMQVAGHSLGITGGHCDENGYRPGLFDPDPQHGVANGVEQVRAAVRYQTKYGADVIKTCATGGVLSEGDAVGVLQYTLEELTALVEEAHRQERRVAAHAHGAEGIKIAVRAGVTSIEHGSFLDEEGARLMAQHGTVLVPTISAGEYVEGAAKSGRLTGLRAEKALAAAQGMRNSVRLAMRNGVPIALGTDAGVGNHGTNGHEFTLLVTWGGLTPMQAITAGTLAGARLL